RPAPTGRSSNPWRALCAYDGRHGLLDARLRACEGIWLASWRRGSAMMMTRSSLHRVLSGGSKSQPPRRYEVVGEGMPQRHGFGFEQATDSYEAEAVVLAIRIEPLDQLARPVNLPASVTDHPVPPFFDTVRLARSFVLPLPERFRRDALGLDRRRCIYRDRACWMCRQCGDVLDCRIMGIEQEPLRSLAVAPHDVVDHGRGETGIVAPIRHLHRDNDTVRRHRCDLRIVAGADSPIGKRRLRASGSLNETVASDFLASSLACLFARSFFSARMRSSTACAFPARCFTSLAARSRAARLRRQEASGSLVISAFSAASRASTAASISTSRAALLNEF